jgi:hypothetical protein
MKITKARQIVTSAGPERVVIGGRRQKKSSMNAQCEVQATLESNKGCSNAVGDERRNLLPTELKGTFSLIHL